MKIHTAHAYFTNCAVKVSITSSDMDESTINTLLNAVDTKGVDVNCNMLRQVLNERILSYGLCEGYDWQALSGVGTTRELALRELTKMMVEWLPSWVANYSDVSVVVDSYLKSKNPTQLTDITNLVQLVHL